MGSGAIPETTELGPVFSAGVGLGAVSSLHRVRLALLVFAALVTAAPAFAWLSVTVNGDSANVELAEDGTAVVRHEVLVRVRGGPLRELSFEGVDGDAEFVGEATLTRARSGQAAGPPILLVPEREAERLRLKVSLEKGVSAGSYLVRFAYRTDLRGRGLIRASADYAEIAWTGPAFSDGIDSLETTFVLPKAELAPHFPGAEPGESVALVAREDGAFLSELERGADVDRLRLSRPHAARQERVTWRARVDRSLMSNASQLEPVEAVPAAAPRASATPSARVQEPRLPAVLSWLGILGAALGFLLLVELKHQRAQTRFLVPLPAWARRCGLFGTMAASLAWALISESAALAGPALIAAMLLTLQKPPRTAVLPRGPGRWRPVDLGALGLETSPAERRASWLDAGSGIGLASFVVALAAFAVMGLRLLGQSPYHSAMTLVYSTSLVPLFFTLGSSATKSLVQEQAEFLTRLLRRLKRMPGVTGGTVGRFSLDEACPDELRLRLDVAGARPGLVAAEVGLGFIDTSLRRLLVPALIVRVRDDSPAHRALPREAHWSRGRDADERVAVIRAPLPLLSSCVETLKDVAARLVVPTTPAGRAPRAAPSAHPPRKTRSRSSGSGELTSKAGTSGLPGQLTR